MGCGLASAGPDPDRNGQMQRVRLLRDAKIVLVPSLSATNSARA